MLSRAACVAVTAICAFSVVAHLSQPTALISKEDSLIVWVGLGLVFLIEAFRKA